MRGRFETFRDAACLIQGSCDANEHIHRELQMCFYILDFFLLIDYYTAARSTPLPHPHAYSQAPQTLCK